MENKNPKNKEEAITDLLIQKEKKRDKRPLIIKIADALTHEAKVFKDRHSKIR